MVRTYISHEWYAVLCTLHHVPFVLTGGPIRQSTMRCSIDKHLQQTIRTDVSSSTLRPHLLIALGFDCLFIALTHNAPPVSSPTVLYDVEHARDNVGSLHRGASRPAQTNRIGFILLSSASQFCLPCPTVTEYPYSPHCSTVLFSVHSLQVNRTQSQPVRS
jgi:hypothetical protein